MSVLVPVGERKRVIRVRGNRYRSTLDDAGVARAGGQHRVSMLPDAVPLCWMTYSRLATHRSTLRPRTCTTPRSAAAAFRSEHGVETVRRRVHPVTDANVMVSAGPVSRRAQQLRSESAGCSRPRTRCRSSGEATSTGRTPRYGVARTAECRQRSAPAHKSLKMRARVGDRRRRKEHTGGTVEARCHQLAQVVAEGRRPDDGVHRARRDLFGPARAGDRRGDA